jgi:hypothetical protein
MSEIHPTLRKLIPYVMAYGAARQIPNICTGTISQRYYNEETKYHQYKDVPLLYTQGIALMGLSSITALAFFPFMLYADVKKTERYMRGIPTPERFSSFLLVDYLIGIE